MAETYSGIDLEVHSRCRILIILIIIRPQSISRFISTTATLLYDVCHGDLMNYVCTYSLTTGSLLPQGRVCKLGGLSAAPAAPSPPGG